MEIHDMDERINESGTRLVQFDTSLLWSANEIPALKTGPNKGDAPFPATKVGDPDTASLLNEAARTRGARAGSSKLSETEPVRHLETNGGVQTDRTGLVPIRQPRNERAYLPSQEQLDKVKACLAEATKEAITGLIDKLATGNDEEKKAASLQLKVFPEALPQILERMDQLEKVVVIPEENNPKEFAHFNALRDVIEEHNRQGLVKLFIEMSEWESKFSPPPPGFHPAGGIELPNLMPKQKQPVDRKKN